MALKKKIYVRVSQILYFSPLGLMLARSSHWYISKGLGTDNLLLVNLGRGAAKLLGSPVSGVSPVKGGAHDQSIHLVLLHMSLSHRSQAYFWRPASILS